MASTSNSYPYPKPCSHLANFKKNHGLIWYRSLRIPFKRSKTSIPRCSFCSKTLDRLYLCLICSQVHCSDHFLIHIQASSGHAIAVDVKRSELYCFHCLDQVYNIKFDKIVEMKRSRGQKKKTVDEKTQMGLRGLNNLGNTCFMNSILQALVHTPTLKDYFLGHRDVCRVRKRRKASGIQGELSCLACDVDGVFSAVFSGDRTPYSPAEFLYSWWQHSASFAGYEQQDAHEFFISILDRIHEKEQPNRSKGIGDSHCIDLPCCVYWDWRLSLHCP